jgi:hypothetical protein
VAIGLRARNLDLRLRGRCAMGKGILVWFGLRGVVEGIPGCALMAMAKWSLSALPS